MSRWLLLCAVAFGCGPNRFKTGDGGIASDDGSISSANASEEEAGTEPGFSNGTPPWLQNGSIPDAQLVDTTNPPPTDGSTPTDAPVTQPTPDAAPKPVPDAAPPPPDAKTWVADGVSCGGGVCYDVCCVNKAFQGSCTLKQNCGTGLFSSTGYILECDGPEDCGGNACCHVGGKSPLDDGLSTECSFSSQCSGSAGVACHSRSQCPSFASNCCQKSGWTTHVCTADPGGDCL